MYPTQIKTCILFTQEVLYISTPTSFIWSPDFKNIILKKKSQIWRLHTIWDDYVNIQVRQLYSNRKQIRNCLGLEYKRGEMTTNKQEKLKW